MGNIKIICMLLCLYFTGCSGEKSPTFQKPEYAKYGLTQTDYVLMQNALESQSTKQITGALQVLLKKKTLLKLFYGEVLYLHQNSNDTEIKQLTTILLR